MVCQVPLPLSPPSPPPLPVIFQILNCNLLIYINPDLELCNQIIVSFDGLNLRLPKTVQYKLEFHPSTYCDGGH